MKERPRNLAASVRQRLLTLSRAQGEEFQLILTRYALERLLYRISQSRHSMVLILKGAMLFRIWSDQHHRPTKDLDLLGYGEVSFERFEEMFREICEQVVKDDGLRFDARSVQSERIKEDQDYEGLRIRCIAILEQARIPLQIDIGFGDAITPAAEAIDYPTLLTFPAPTLRAYPRETVIAEKYQALVALGIANSRMKDFYDIWFLARHFAFAGATLSKAIRATFERRRTPLPAEPPLALTREFYDDSAKIQQWQGFVRKSKLAATSIGLADIAAVLTAFLWPPTIGLLSRQEFNLAWPTGGPWV